MIGRRWNRSKAELAAQRQDREQRLLTLLARCDGRPCPSNDALGRALALPLGTMVHIIARLAEEGRIVSNSRPSTGGTPGGFSRRLAATDGSWATLWSGAGGSAITAAELAEWAPAATVEYTSIPVVLKPSPVRTRCPRCNLPPDHRECRHGWNGQTTAAERRNIAFAEGRAA